jgi:heme-degrading monooxygenase HmoA
MIARFWRGVTRPKDHQAYLDYLKRTGVPEILNITGNRGIQLLHRADGAQAEFLFISFWDSFDAIRKFAGSNADTAVYYPEDRAYLLELSPNVIHYEVEEFAAGAGIQEKPVRKPEQR